MRRNLLAPGPAPAAVNVPEEFGEISPFLWPVLPHRAVKQGIYVGIGLIQKGELLVVPSGMFHHHPCLTVQAFQAVCQLLEFTAGVARLKRFCHNFEVLEAALAGAGNFGGFEASSVSKATEVKGVQRFFNGEVGPLFAQEVLREDKQAQPLCQEHHRFQRGQAVPAGKEGVKIRLGIA